MLQRFYRIILTLFCIPLIIGIITNVFTKRYWPLTLILLVLLGCWLFWRPKVARYCQTLSNKQIKWLVAVALSLILLIQLFSLKELPVSVYHDPYRVLYQAQRLSQGSHNWGETTYFWHYPTNVPVTWILAGWLYITAKIGLSTVWAMNLINLLLLDCFILVSVKLIYRYSISRLGLLEYLFFLIVSSFSYTYYLKVFYTDMPLLLALIVDFYILLSWSNSSTKKRILAVIVLLAVNIFAQLAKSNFAIIALAVVLVVALFAKKQRASIHRLYQPLLAIVLGCLLALPTGKIMQNQVGFHHNEQYQVALTHWIHMGYNPQTHGIYSGDDVHNFMKHKDPQDQKLYLKQQLKNRLQHLGPLGIVKQWFAKTSSLLNINSWICAYNGGFIKIPRGYSAVQAFLHYWGVLMNQLGYIILFSAALIVTLKNLFKKTSPNLVNWLSLITAGGFLLFYILIWEVNNRYGQVLIPLLLVYLCTAKQTPQLAIKWRKSSVLTVVSCLAVIFGICLVDDLHAKPQKMSVATQTSQLSHQFKFKTPEFRQISLIEQQITLNHAVNNFTLLIPKRANYTTTLQNTKTKKYYPVPMTYPLASNQSVIPAGTYKLQLKTIDPQNKIRVVLTSGLGLKIAQQDVLLDNKPLHHTSLVYKASYDR
ncbi:hypothetical protein [Bombilactobacillus thymidiniphilus]|uniref:Dolichyl-phosphate-mannose-protein mannosyltransferase n=1 Tax=Bombilactobacillus thymidiniphilus TaxID=2923363 RepID=A0ABY4PBN2_9LACO|nr:hypothetical protein [Bombilactobacillus thymidiniphilus]UQS83180.1 hypothetical protein MOO47_05180 [Bombilactobacillus thymidiniphilus]